MADVLRRDRLGPPLVAVAAALAVNAALRLFGIEGDGADAGPPGWVIGGVWTIIFAAFGASYAALARAPVATRRERAALVGLGAFCLAYPAYTAGFDLRWLSLAGTLATFAYALVLVGWFWPVSRAAALWLAPLGPWLGLAAYLILA